MTSIVIGVVVGAGRTMFPQPDDVPPVMVSAAPTSAASTPSPTAGPSSIPAGPFELSVAGLRVQVDLPGSWRPAAWTRGITRVGPDGSAPRIEAITIDAVFPQGCRLPMLTRRTTDLDARGLAAELGRAGDVTSTRSDLVVGGYPASMVTVDVPDTGCGSKLTNLWVGPRGWLAGAPGSHHRLLIIDGPDGTGVIDAFVPAGDPPERRDEIARILRSATVVDAVDQSPSPSRGTQTGSSQVELRTDRFRVGMELPNGWSIASNGREARFAASDGPSGPIIRLTTIDTVYQDPCIRQHHAYQTGRTDADELAARIVLASGYRAVRSTATLAGREVVRIDVEVPADLTTCRTRLLDLWASGPRLEAASPGERHVLFVFDVDGGTVAIDVESEPTGPAWATAGVDAILASITGIEVAPEASAPGDLAEPTGRRVLQLDGVQVSLDVPRAWRWQAEGREIMRPVPGQALGPTIRIMTIDTVFADCRYPYLTRSPGARGTADHLADRIESVSWYRTARYDREIDGRPVVVIHVDVPDDLTSCGRTYGNLWASDTRIESAVAGDHHELLIVDIDGRRIVIDGDVGADDPPSSAADVVAILATASFEVVGSEPLG